MKNLSLISFVGVDKHTNLMEILPFIQYTPLICEFGVLYSESKRSIRYPDYEFCRNFIDWIADYHIRSSLHLCGSEAINNFLEEDPSIIKLCNFAGRTQLNINIKNFTDYDELSDKILDIAIKYNITVILQKNATKQKFNELVLKKLNNAKNIHFLNDSSGGFGREISKVDEPSANYFTGYAGGINPENVSKIVSLIEGNNPNNNPYYIDMESGIRENNIFSLKKCKEILDKIK